MPQPLGRIVVWFTASGIPEADSRNELAAERHAKGEAIELYLRAGFPPGDESPISTQDAAILASLARGVADHWPACCPRRPAAGGLAEQVDAIAAVIEAHLVLDSPEPLWSEVRGELGLDEDALSVARERIGEALRSETGAFAECLRQFPGPDSVDPSVGEALRACASQIRAGMFVYDLPLLQAAYRDYQQYRVAWRPQRRTKEQPDE